jgi:hypothetical protein
VVCAHNKGIKGRGPAVIGSTLGKTHFWKDGKKERTTWDKRKRNTCVYKLRNKRIKQGKDREYKRDGNKIRMALKYFRQNEFTLLK